MLTSSSRGLVIGQVNPAKMDIDIKVALISGRSGKPKDILLAPMVILTPNSLTIILMLSIAIWPARWSDPIVKARGKIHLQNRLTVRFLEGLLSSNTTSIEEAKTQAESLLVFV